MVGIPGLPQAKPIVVFDSHDNHLHARRLHHPAPLIGIKRLQVKNFRIFLPIPPFLTGECIGAHVNKSDKLVFESIQLVGCRDNLSSLPYNGFLTFAQLHRNGRKSSNFFSQGKRMDHGNANSRLEQYRIIHTIDD